jgi:hypothetical protein
MNEQEMSCISHVSSTFLNSLKLGRKKCWSLMPVDSPEVNLAVKSALQ